MLGLGVPAVETQPQTPDALAGTHELEAVGPVAVILHLHRAFLAEWPEQQALHGVAAGASRVAERVVGPDVNLANAADDQAQVIETGHKTVKRSAGGGVQNRIPRLGQPHGVPAVLEHVVVVEDGGCEPAGLRLEVATWRRRVRPRDLQVAAICAIFVHVVREPVRVNLFNPMSS